MDIFIRALHSKVVNAVEISICWWCFTGPLLSVWLRKIWSTRDYWISLKWVFFHLSGLGCTHVLFTLLSSSIDFVYMLEVCQNRGILPIRKPKCLPFIELNLKITLQQYLSSLMPLKAGTYKHEEAMEKDIFSGKE